MPQSDELNPALADIPGAFGNTLRLRIIIFLVENESATRGELAAALDAYPKTVQFHLGLLETLRMVTSDPPPGTRRNGLRVRYALNEARRDELWASLGVLIGATPPHVATPY